MMALDQLVDANVKEKSMLEELDLKEGPGMKVGPELCLGYQDGLLALL